MKPRAFLRLQLAVFLGVAFAGLPGLARGQGETVSEPGLFSYQAPQGWSVKTTPISKFKISFDAPKNGFSANINVVAEVSPGSLAKYVDANEAILKATPMFQNLEVLDQKTFTTAARVAGVRVRVRDSVGNAHLLQTFYFFPGAAETKFVVTASCLAADGDAYAPIFNASMKTFSLP